MRARPRKTLALKLGTKFFGRTIRAFRLSLGISQEELAGKANVSVALVGMVEREQSRLSEQTLCGLCLGLESEAGRPMLRAVYDGAIGALWEELRSVEIQMRKDRGFSLPEDVDEHSSDEEEFRRKLDAYIEAERNLASLVFRLGLGVMPIPGIKLPIPLVGSRKVRVVRPKTEKPGATKPRRKGHR